MSGPNIDARLAQSVEHETLNLRVVGSSPTLGDPNFLWASFEIDKKCNRFERNIQVNHAVKQ